jgi:hypothetical protein
MNKKEKIFPIWCASEEEKNELKFKLEEIRKLTGKSNKNIILQGLNEIEKLIYHIEGKEMCNEKNRNFN